MVRFGTAGFAVVAVSSNFVGPDYEAAVVPECGALLSRYDERSAHYEILMQPQPGMPHQISVGQPHPTHPMRFHFSSHVWLAEIAQGLLATAAAYQFWNWGLASIPAARAGVFINLEPLVGTLLEAFVLGESLGALGILGGALILLAAAYFSWPKTPGHAGSMQQENTTVAPRFRAA